MESVSIIIPCYNVAEWIEACLDSVLCQKITDIEVICINDGSSDNTLEILQRYHEQDPRILVVSQKNRGLSDARNKGLRLAKGKYVYFLDADDLLSDCDILSFCVSVMERYKLDILYGGAIVFYDDEKLEKKFGKQFNSRYKISHNYEGIFKGTDLIRATRLNNDYYEPVGLKFYSRYFLQSNRLRFIKGQLHEDNIYTFKSLFLAERVMAMSRPLYKRRIRRDSIMTRGRGPSNVQGNLINFIESLRFLEKQRKKRAFDEVVGFEPRRDKNSVLNMYLDLNESQQREFINLLTPDQRFYFETFIRDMITLKIAAQRKRQENL